MVKLISINIDEVSEEAYATLDPGKRMLDARDTATELIANYPEEFLPAIYNFLSDITAQMAAMSDNPAALSSDLTAKIDLYESQFQILKRGTAPFRLCDLAKGMKS